MKPLPVWQRSWACASGAAHYCMRGETCDLFNYSALHFYPTIQNATWELIALKIHLYNLLPLPPRAHKLSHFEEGRPRHAGTSGNPFRAARSDTTERSGPNWMDCSLGAERGWGVAVAAWWDGVWVDGGKKYTCYLVNPQTCKIGIPWMSATEAELTRGLFIVLEGH